MKKINLVFLFVLSAIGAFSQTTLPYTQDFEGTTFPPTGWQFFGSLSSPTWERNDSIGGYGNSFACAFFDNFTVNHSGNYFGMRAPMMDLTGNSHPFLIFDVAYARRSSSQSETLGLWYSTNGTSNWQNIANYSNSTLTSAPDETNYFIPQNTQWRTIVKDLSAFANYPAIRFAFENNSDNGNVLYLDNVRFIDSSFVSVNMPFSPKENYLIFPNPSNGLFSLIKLNGNIQNEKIYIYNVLGKLEMVDSFQSTENALQFDFSKLSAGIYFMTICDENKNQMSQRIVIN